MLAASSQYILGSKWEDAFHPSCLQLFIAPPSTTLATVQTTLNPIKFKSAGGNTSGSVT